MQMDGVLDPNLRKMVCSYWQDGHAWGLGQRIQGFLLQIDYDLDWMDWQ